MSTFLRASLLKAKVISPSLSLRLMKRSKLRRLMMVVGDLPKLLLLLMVVGVELLLKRSLLLVVGVLIRMLLQQFLLLVVDGLPKVLSLLSQLFNLHLDGVNRLSQLNQLLAGVFSNLRQLYQLNLPLDLGVNLLLNMLRLLQLLSINNLISNLPLSLGAHLLLNMSRLLQLLLPNSLPNSQPATGVLRLLQHLLHHLLVNGFNHPHQSNLRLLLHLGVNRLLNLHQSAIAVGLVHQVLLVPLPNNHRLHQHQLLLKLMHGVHHLLAGVQLPTVDGKHSHA
jgi:hypothetical protein